MKSVTWYEIKVFYKSLAFITREFHFREFYNRKYLYCSRRKHVKDKRNNYFCCVYIKRDDNYSQEIVPSALELTR